MSECASTPKTVLPVSGPAGDVGCSATAGRKADEISGGAAWGAIAEGAFRGEGREGFRAEAPAASGSGSEKPSRGFWRPKPLSPLEFRTDRLRWPAMTCRPETPQSWASRDPPCFAAHKEARGLGSRPAPLSYRVMAQATIVRSASVGSPQRAMMSDHHCKGVKAEELGMEGNGGAGLYFAAANALFLLGEGALGMSRRCPGEGGVWGRRSLDRGREIATMVLIIVNFPRDEAPDQARPAVSTEPRGLFRHV
jgi:hypothetical protein